MLHFIQAKNLLYSINDVKKITESSVSHLIKPTQPFEQLNIDFKGPIPTISYKIFENNSSFHVK